MLLSITAKAGMRSRTTMGKRTISAMKIRMRSQQTKMMTMNFKPPRQEAISWLSVALGLVIQIGG